MIRKLPAWVWFGGIILTFAAGLINAVALLSFINEAATHVTGSITRASSAIASGDLEMTLHLSAMILCFFSGAVISGIITRGSRLQLGRRYGFALALECILLAASMLRFQHNMMSGQLLASLACGLQNGMLTTFSGAIIRTTHMTGTITDLGTQMGHWLMGIGMDKRRFLLNILLLAGFSVGGIAGTLVFKMMSYQALIIPVILTGLASFFYTSYVVYVRNHNGDMDFN